MKVQNMTSSKGNKIANQFIIKDAVLMGEGIGYRTVTVFQSYDRVICKIICDLKGKRVYLDYARWDYAGATGKYRDQFLGESKQETQKKIDSGEYILVNLN